MLNRENAFLLHSRKTAWEYLAKAVFTNGPVSKIDPIMPYIKAGTTVIDIGSSMGFFSQRFARKAGLVIAFEPQGMPRAVMTVASFFRQNRNIILVPCALGAGEGLLALSIPIKSGRKVGTSLAHIGNDADFSGRFAVEKELVACTTLDMALSHIETGPISMIKIDVEGGELNVLKGAEKTLATHRPNIVCEIDYGRETRFGASAEDLYDWITARGYTAVGLESGEPVTRDRLENNTVFVPV